MTLLGITTLVSLVQLNEATKADNVFGGWYTADGTKLSAGDMLTKDTEASAHWYPGGEFWYYDTDAKTFGEVPMQSMRCSQQIPTK